MGQEPLAHYNFSTNNNKKEPTYCSNSQASTILVPQTAMRRGCTCGAGGEVPAEELDAPLLDLERGRGQDHTVAPTWRRCRPPPWRRPSGLPCCWMPRKWRWGRPPGRPSSVFFGYVPTPDLIDAELMESHRSISSSQHRRKKGSFTLTLLLISRRFSDGTDFSSCA